MKSRPMIFDTKIESRSSSSLEAAFRNFLNEDDSYRNQFLQKEYSRAFDGYSFYGQSDSLNQYAQDLLHSFVLSNFTPFDEFPAEFHSFFEEDFEETLLEVREIERNWLVQYGNEELLAFYKESIGHMISCNYYPPVDDLDSTERFRLSQHTDVSFLTVFPYGISSGLSYRDNQGKSIALGEKNTIPLFAGYSLEFLSEGKIPALAHQVDLPEDRGKERFSFAYFSIPKPGSVFRVSGKPYTAEEFYQQYLNLF